VTKIVMLERDLYKETQRLILGQGTIFARDVKKRDIKIEIVYLEVMLPTDLIEQHETERGYGLEVESIGSFLESTGLLDEFNNDPRFDKEHRNSVQLLAASRDPLEIRNRALGSVLIYMEARKPTA